MQSIQVVDNHTVFKLRMLRLKGITIFWQQNISRVLTYLHVKEPPSYPPRLALNNILEGQPFLLN